MYNGVKMTFEIEHKTVNVITHKHDVQDDADAFVHYESTYEGSDIIGSLKQGDGYLMIYLGGEWVRTIYADLNHFKRHYGSYIIWEA